MVTFVWPWVLLSLLAVPLCLFLYLRLQRKRSMAAERLGALGGILGGTAVMAGKRRHIPPVILLIAVAFLAAASARPHVSIPLPRLEGTMMLAMDVSSSMAADDVQPSRLEAAKLTAKALVEQRPAGALVGVVAFGQGGLIVQSPTDDVEALNATIDRLTPDHGTSLARGILTALHSITSATPETRSEQPSLEAAGSSPDSYASAIIVLLTDGENTESIDPIEAAQIAIERGVRVHTVGIGTQDGTTVEVEGFNLFTQLNEPVLEEIALQTEGTYFSLSDIEGISAIYDDLNKEFTVEPREIEVTSLVGAFSAFLLVAGGALSLFWFGRTP